MPGYCGMYDVCGLRIESAQSTGCGGRFKSQLRTLQNEANKSFSFNVDVF